MKTLEDLKKSVVASADLSEKWSKEFMEKTPSGPDWHEYNSPAKLRKACEQTAQELGFTIYDAQAIYVMLSQGWNDILDWATGHDVAMQSAIDAAKQREVVGDRMEFCRAIAKEFKLHDRDAEVIHYAVFEDHKMKEVVEE